MKREVDWLCCCTSVGIGETFSTGGREAQGDLGAEVFEVRVGFSAGVFDCIPLVLVCFLSEFAPSLKTVALGPTEVGLGAMAFGIWRDVG